MPSASSIPPELAAALRALDPLLPEASHRAATALERILANQCPTCDGANGGRLTGDGFPVELVFTSADAAVRYTCEAGDSRVAARDRLEHARILLDAFQQPKGFPLPSLQVGCSSLSWGAWLGGCHTATSDRYKLYVEAPGNLTPSARRELSELLGRYQALLESHEYALRIAGYDPVSGKIELYFRGRELEPPEVRALLRFSGLGHREEALFSLLEEATQRPARVRLPGTQHGFSISLLAAGEVETFTFCAFARSLFGADPNTRSALLTLSKHRSWNFEPYAAVSSVLQKGRGPRHGIVSFTVERSGSPGISVGLRPVIPS